MFLRRRIAAALGMAVGSMVLGNSSMPQQHQQFDQRKDVNIGIRVYKECLRRGSFPVDPSDRDAYCAYLTAEPMLSRQELDQIPGLHEKVSFEISHKPKRDGSGGTFESYAKRQILARSWVEDFGSLKYGNLQINVPDEIKAKCSPAMLFKLQDLATNQQRREFISAPKSIGYYDVKHVAQLKLKDSAGGYAKLSLPGIVSVHVRAGNGVDCERLLVHVTNQGQLSAFQWFDWNEYDAYQEYLQNMLVRNSDNDAVFMDLYDKYVQTGSMT